MKKKPFYKLIVSICFLLILFIACADEDNTPSQSLTGDRSTDSESQTNLPQNDDKVTIAQGAWGNVWYWEGDFMPGCPSGKIYPVKRQLYIFEATNIDSVDLYEFGPYFINIRSKLIKITDSGNSGFFQASLDPGIYSIFIKDLLDIHY